VGENTFNVIRLFDFDANADRVNGRFDKDLFVLISSNVHWIENNFGRRPEISALEREG